MPKIRKNTYGIDNIHNKLYLDQCGSVAVFDEGSHLVEDNNHTNTWSFDYTDLKFEHVMHKFLDYYPQPLNDRKLEVHPYACLKSLLHLICNVVIGMTFELY